MRWLAAVYRRVRRRPAVELTVDEPDLRQRPRVRGVVAVRGWALGARGIERVEVLCDGAVVGQTQLGLARADVAAVHPGWLGADQAASPFRGTPRR